MSTVKNASIIIWSMVNVEILTIHHCQFTLSKQLCIITSSRQGLQY